jgi:hypothetical protein
MGSIKIAVVQDRDGYLTCCGPDDMGKEHKDSMDAAMSWHLEAGHLPAALYWVEIELPPVPTIPELRAKVAVGEFPKTLIAEWDAPEPVITQHQYLAPSQ